MKELTQIVREAISGMFTTNVTEEVVKRVVEAVKGDEGVDEERTGTVQKHL